jgi:NAD(P)-dependent dehydrogenase (short-subunit alcohol dehydrogenase family)
VTDAPADLAGRVVIVTGGTRGIGLGVDAMLSRTGPSVVIVACRRWLHHVQERGDGDVRCDLRCALRSLVAAGCVTSKNAPTQRAATVPVARQVAFPLWLRNVEVRADGSWVLGQLRR